MKYFICDAQELIERAALHPGGAAEFLRNYQRIQHLNALQQQQLILKLHKTIRELDADELDLSQRIVEERGGTACEYREALACITELAYAIRGKV